MLNDLYTLVHQARETYEVILAKSFGHVETAGSCFYASVVLVAALQQFSDCRKVIIRGGDGLADGGYCAPDGTRHGHYWVEATTPVGVLVLDIASDQFGGLPVTILHKDVAAQYVPGEQAITDAQVKTHLDEMALDQGKPPIRLDWLA